MTHRHAIQCIIPPHMVEEIEENGTPAQREKARETRFIAADLRAQRTEARAARAAPSAQPGKSRTIYDARNSTQLPGQRVRLEGGPETGDVAVEEAYEGSGDTYDLYRQVYGRDSLDDGGLELISTVHYGRGYDNAIWNGQQMAYGDGDEDLPPEQRLFNRFTASLDVIGHELTHGVTQYTARLVYQGQSGALNESFSDVFGSLVRQWKRGETVDAAHWLIGAELLTSNVNGRGIRSMKEPGTAYDDPVLGRDPQPGHMRDYVTTTADNGGVHINSGIPNHAFYITARELGGRAWERAGRIWYRTLTSGQLSASADFQAAASLTFSVAGAEFGAGSREQQAVRTAWAEVGINVESAPGPEPAPIPTPGGSGCLWALLTSSF
jgi:Zn-dependent metalloprotease